MDLYNTVQSFDQSLSEYGLGSEARDKYITKGLGYISRKGVDVVSSMKRKAGYGLVKESDKRVRVPPRKIKIMPPSGTVNRLAGRATMSKSGSKNIKSRQKKKVKVSRGLRRKISEVMKDKQISGTYKLVRQGVLGFATLEGALTTLVTNSVLGMAVQNPVTMARDTEATSNMMTTFVHLPYSFAAGADMNNALLYTSNNWMAYFHPLKFLDAASVLWNNKPLASGWDVTTGNITTRVGNGTGAIDTGPQENFKLDIVNSFVTFEIKNNSQRQITLKIYNVITKVKVAKETAITAYIKAVGEGQSSNGCFLTNAVSATAATCDPLIAPGHVQTFNQNFKYECVTAVIKPGETCKHTLQGPKNHTYDFGKLFLNNDNIENYVPKGTVQVMIQVMPDLVNTVRAQGFEVGRFHGPNVAGKATPYFPLTVEVTEHYRLKCPVTAGFIQRATVAGQGMPLNLKRPVRAFNNWNNNNYGEASINYTGADEEQPATAIVAGERY